MLRGDEKRHGFLVASRCKNGGGKPIPIKAVSLYFVANRGKDAINLP
jgi:hypothetical protein